MTNPPEKRTLTDVQRLAVLDIYLKLLKPIGERLRERVTKQMGDEDQERVAARLPGGPKIASIGYSDGRTTVTLTDGEAALAWCLKKYPSEVVTIQAIRPAFLKKLLDAAKDQSPGNHGYDPETGEELPFIDVGHGSPFVTVTTTPEGIAQISGLVDGFSKMLEGPQ